MTGGRRGDERGLSDFNKFLQDSIKQEYKKVRSGYDAEIINVI